MTKQKYHLKFNNNKFYYQYSIDKQNTINVIERPFSIYPKELYNISDFDTNDDFVVLDNGIQYIGNTDLTFEIIFQLIYKWDYIYQLSLSIDIYISSFELQTYSLYSSKLIGVSNVRYINNINNVDTSFYVSVKPFDIIHIYIGNPHPYIVNILKNSVILFKTN